MSEAICSWWEERDLKQGAKRRSGKSRDGWPKRLLAKFPIPLPYALNLIYDTTRLAILCSKAKERHMHWNRIDGTTSGCAR